MPNVYEFHLPVYKQGDDLGHQIQLAKGDRVAALKAQASLYQEAANMCLRLASVASEERLEIFADAHVIEVDGPVERMKALVKDGLLSELECSECDCLDCQCEVSEEEPD